VYDRARAVAVFSSGMQELIHGLKYSDRHDGRRLFGRWLVAAGAELLADADVLVPVPLNRWRLLSRRFNQSALLAQEVARLSGVDYAPLALSRVRATASQVGMTREERRRNVTGAFAVPARAVGQVAGRRIVLVDDVITTGATVQAAARVLKAAGAARVDVLALAVVVI
jgi:ComF family protein